LWHSTGVLCSHTVITDAKCSFPYILSFESNIPLYTYLYWRSNLIGQIFIFLFFLLLFLSMINLLQKFMKVTSSQFQFVWICYLMSL
jgi:hypothetical protein